jgi:hypothetical protein
MFLKVLRLYINVSISTSFSLALERQSYNVPMFLFNPLNILLSFPGLRLCILLSLSWFPSQDSTSHMDSMERINSALITGGCGALGHRVVKELLKPEPPPHVHVFGYMTLKIASLPSSIT